MQNKLENYLRPTKYCDSDNEKIVDFATRITKGCSNDLDRLKCLFNFIKNHYKYSFGEWRLKASEVVNKKDGMCTTKTNLFVACLRSLNIPAGFHVIKINARDIFGNFTNIKFLRNKISNNSVHIYSDVFVNNQWISLDPSLDDSLIEGLTKFGYKHSLTQWDGKSSYVNFIHEDMVLEDLGIFSNIDYYHEKNRRTARLLFTLLSKLLMNHYRIIGRLK